MISFPNCSITLRFLREKTSICFVKSFLKWGVFVILSLLGQLFKYKINIRLCIPLRRSSPGCHHCFRKKQGIYRRPCKFPFSQGGTLAALQDIHVKTCLFFFKLNVKHNFSLFVKPEVSLHHFQHVIERPKFQDYHIHLTCPRSKNSTPITYLT